jgi:hypothetical protein
MTTIRSLKDVLDALASETQPMVTLSDGTTGFLCSIERDWTAINVRYWVTLNSPCIGGRIGHCVALAKE